MSEQPPASFLPFHPRYNQPPFCNPEACNESAVAILDDFEPEAVGGNTISFRTALFGIYDSEKGPQARTAEEEDVWTSDLTNSDDVDGLVRHTTIHAVTGNVEWGLSDTSCIPAWDREAAIIGQLIEYGFDNAQEYIEIMDALSINVLRAYCVALNSKVVDCGTNIALLIDGRSRGQRSKVNVEEKQTERLSSNQDTHSMYASLFLAKLKHLTWLVDQQTDPTLRHLLLPELYMYWHQAEAHGHLETAMRIDMGADTGMSAASDRPPYDISGFVQLRHLGQDTYALPDAACHKLSAAEMLESIARKDSTPPFYEEDGRYRLPWRF